MYIDTKHLCDVWKIANHFGEKTQLDKTKEELVELEDAITDYTRDPLPFTHKNIQHIAEEMADVHIMLEQVAYLLGIKDSDLNEIIIEKIARTLERIESGYYEDRSTALENKHSFTSRGGTIEISTTTPKIHAYTINTDQELDENNFRKLATFVEILMQKQHGEQ